MRDGWRGPSNDGDPPQRRRHGRQGTSERVPRPGDGRFQASRETIYGVSVRAAAERATEARKEADRLAVAAWNRRMLGFQGPAQPSPTLGDAINAGYGYLAS